MSTYTTRFGVASVAANASVLLYTAPVGATSIIRDILVVNLGGTGGVFNLHVTSGSLTTYVAASQSQAALETFHLDLRQVMEVGDTLTFTSGNNPFSVMVTGYQLVP